MKLAAVLVVASCASAQQSQPTTVEGNLHAADTHEAKAMERDRQARIAGGNPETFNCGDTVIADQTTTGGERLDFATPCFDVTEEAAVQERFAAQREATEAKQDRQMAANLAETELHSCHGIQAHEREHSPFAHKRAIEAVAPAGNGVRIIFKPIAGLTAQWLESDIKCHQARYATLGQPIGYMPDDPTLVPGAHVTVTERARHIEVLVETADADSGQLALQRARDLVAPAAAAK